MRRFSRLALPLVLVAIGTGVTNAGFVFPSPGFLWESDYGYVLIGKLLILTAPLALAARNRHLLKRAVDAAVPAIRGTVRLEAIVVLVVVLGGSLLALLAPPISEAETPLVADVPLPAFAANGTDDLLVHLLVEGGRPGDYETGVRLEQYDKTPYTGEPPALVRLAFSNLAVSASPATVDAVKEPDGSWSVRGTYVSLPGWWQIDVMLRWLGQPDAVVTFYMLYPDPNLNGMDAPGDDPRGDPAAAGVYEQAMARYTGLHRMRYEQSMATHTGTVAYGVHVVNDGADGSTPGYTFDIPGGWHYVVLGETGWSQRPGEPWTQREANQMIPPSEWDEEYTGARGFQFGRTEEIDGELCQVIMFVVPEAPKRVVAWYVWWVGTETGHVRQEMMISRSHYMLSRFSAFDEPAPIVPPNQQTGESDLTLPA